MREESLADFRAGYIKVDDSGIHTMLQIGDRAYCAFGPTSEGLVLSWEVSMRRFEGGAGYRKVSVSPEAAEYLSETIETAQSPDHDDKKVRTARESVSEAVISAYGEHLHVGDFYKGRELPSPRFADRNELNTSEQEDFHV